MVKRTVYRRTFKFRNVDGEAHFLTFSCFRKRAFLSRDRTRQYVIDALERARAKFGFDLWAYVIMPTHVHLLLFPKGETCDMGKVESAIKVSVSRKAINYLRRENPRGLKHLATGEVDTPYRFWMAANGYDQNVVSREAAVKISEYIHNNPVLAGLCLEPEDWIWSSAREWAEEGTSLLRIDRDSFPI